MKPLVKCLPPTEEQIRRNAVEAASAAGKSADEIEAYVRLHLNVPTYKNDVYTVYVDGDGAPDGWLHLSIKRNDREPIHDWRPRPHLTRAPSGRRAVSILPPLQA